MGRHWLHTPPQRGAVSLPALLDLVTRALRDTDSVIEFWAEDWGASYDPRELQADLLIGSPLLRCLHDSLDSLTAHAKQRTVRLVTQGRCIGPAFVLGLAAGEIQAGSQTVLGVSETRAGLPPLLDVTRRLVGMMPLRTALGMVGQGNLVTGTVFQKLVDSGPDAELDFSTVAQYRPRPIASPLPGDAFAGLCTVLDAVGKPADHRYATECAALANACQVTGANEIFDRFSNLLTRDLFPPVSLPSSLAVMGTGQMGSTIAAASAARGVPVTIVGRRLERAEAAKRMAEKFLAAMERRGPLHIDAKEAGNCLDIAVEVPTHVEGVIEAVVENVAVKQEVFARARAAAPAAWLGTTSSALALSNFPEDVSLLHFAYPAEVSPVVEVSYASAADAALVSRMEDYLRGIGKTPLPVASVPGYVISRLLFAYLLEGLALLEGGISPERVDQAALAGGHAIAPLAIVDAAGVSLTDAVAREILAPAYGERFAPPAVLRGLIDAGSEGRKAGIGVYDYGEKAAVPNPVWQIEVRRSGAAAALSPEEIQTRLRLAVVLEACRCAEEGLASPAQLDLLSVTCVRFPSALVGPLAWAGREPAALRAAIAELGGSSPRFASPRTFS